jgi:hypothetical protein
MGAMVADAGGYPAAASAPALHTGHGAMSAMIQRIHRVPLQGRATESVAPVDSDRLSLHCGRALARVAVIQH